MSERERAREIIHKCTLIHPTWKRNSLYNYCWFSSYDLGCTNSGFGERISTSNQLKKCNLGVAHWFGVLYRMNERYARIHEFRLSLFNSSQNGWRLNPLESSRKGEEGEKEGGGWHKHCCLSFPGPARPSHRALTWTLTNQKGTRVTRSASAYPDAYLGGLQKQ